MMLSHEQGRVLLATLQALHARDEAEGLLPAVDRGPPRGILRAACSSVRHGHELPDMHQLPPNVYFAASAVQLLAVHDLTRPQVPGWLRRNLASALRPLPDEVAASLPIQGCRSHEDVRNRLIVGIEDFPLEQLEAFGRRLEAASGKES